MAAETFKTQQDLMKQTMPSPRRASRSSAGSLVLGLLSPVLLTATAPGALAGSGLDRTEIGGSSTAVSLLDTGGTEWVLFNVGNHLRATPAQSGSGVQHDLEVEGYIRDIEILSRGSRRIALLATGTDGIAAVDVTQPAAMSFLTQVGVNFFQDGISWTEGGGDIVADNTISGTHSNISCLVTDGSTLWIGNEDYGIQRTRLGNLLAPGGPVLEADGTLFVDHEKYTLQYAGENPWGGPLSLELVDGRLFAGLGFLGLGIFDASTLEQVGGYNLYTDAGVVEDWFIDMDVAQEVQPGFLDAFTGMPDYRQASFEITEVAHGTTVAPTPWADFDRYGKWYYHARRATVADFGNTSIAYIAYGLGGALAVDVTGFRTATPASYLQGAYLGYAPGVPAHGPEEPTQQGSGGGGGGSLFPHYGAGMLKEAGVVNVAVVGNDLYYTDHFGGLTVLAGADDPVANWQGANAPYDNDDTSLGSGVLGDHWPDYEFVTSYDMTPHDATDNESLPQWMYETPCLLVSGEVGGHGNVFVLHPQMVPDQPGEADVLLCVGSGGFAFIDIIDLGATLLEDRFAILENLPTTDEIGAAPGGTTTDISIGHTQGIVVSRDTLYLADGPHGVTAWKLLEDDGSVADQPHLVANTLQDEYPVDFGGTTYYPTPHAYGVVFDQQTNTVLTLCQGRGLRRLDVSAVEAGQAQVGAPLLLTPQPTDIFEHNTETGSVAGTPKQDHAYDVVLDGHLAFTADGGNGLTIYDLTKDPTDLTSGFVVSNLGGAAQGNPVLGRSTGIALHHDQLSGERYAFMAAGPRGVGVVNVTDETAPFLVKVYEPKKIENGSVGKADGRAVDVLAFEDHAYFSYDSFGTVCYLIEDLIEPLPPGVDPTEIWKVQNGQVLFDYRPDAVAEFRLDEVLGYEEATGGALNMRPTRVGNQVVIYIAYGTSGLAKLDWTDPADPLLLDLYPTPGEASAVVTYQGRLYVADGNGGLMVFH